MLRSLRDALALALIMESELILHASLLIPRLISYTSLIKFQIDNSKCYWRSSFSSVRHGFNRYQPINVRYQRNKSITFTGICAINANQRAMGVEQGTARGV